MTQSFGPILHRLNRGALLTVYRMNVRPSSDMAKFRLEIANANNFLILTGAGISAESGIPTFRGAGGLWRTFNAVDLASPSAFQRSPALVWEFYHYRRELVLSKSPNAGHKAIADFESRMADVGKHVCVVTQNIDELHKVAGTRNLVELHGSLFKTRCTKCGDVSENRDSPICAALAGMGAPDASQSATIPLKSLPHCTKCKGLLRPHVVWFGEGLDEAVLARAYDAMDNCDLCLVVGTSSVVYPAAMFAPSVAHKGITVAEFNLEPTPATQEFGYHFQSPSSESLVAALTP